jgi:hypothetical protein
MKFAVGVVGVTSENECMRKRLEFMKQVENGTYEPWQKRERQIRFTVTDL